MAGIINIVLKQNVDLGLSGGLNAGVSQADRYNASSNVGYQAGPLSTLSTPPTMSCVPQSTPHNRRLILEEIKAPRSHELGHP